MTHTPVYIIAAKRTPLGSFGGKLAGLSAVELGIIASKAAIAQAGIAPEAINEVIYGNVCQANLGQAPARQIAIGSGIGYHVPSTTINKVCASGMKSVMLGAQSIQLGINEVVMCGGTESMSNIPHYLPQLRWGSKYGASQVIDGLQHDGLTDVYDNVAMGTFADNTAVKYDISRKEQDDYAISSYQKAATATEKGLFKAEIAPVSIPQRKGEPLIMDIDEEYSNVMFDKIPQLRPAFSADGTVTAANASTINDGAATIIIASEAYVNANKLKPLAKIISFADAAQEPQWFTTAPTIATPKALDQAGITQNEVDYFEVNEAFAVVPLAFNKVLGIDPAKVNVNGGAVALGHPLGASGARILTTLIYTLIHNEAKIGCAAICNGGGGASAMVIERVF